MDGDVPRDEENGRLADAALVAWIRAAGGTVGPLRVGVSEEGVRGVYATADLAGGDVILEVPRACLLLPADLDVASEALDALLSALGDHVRLALRLLRLEAAAEAGWEPYLASLPTELQGHPLFWPPADLALLAGTAMGPLLDDRLDLLREELRRVRAYALVPATLSEAAWLRVRTLVTSRVFDLHFPDRAVVGLVPYADLFNHGAAGHTAWSIDAKTGAYVLRATVPVAAGAEVLGHYGPKGDLRLLLHYGFTLPDNPEAEGVLQLGAYGAVRVPMGCDDQAFGALLADLRRDMATSEELAEAHDRGGDTRGALSPRNERAVLQAIEDACERGLVRLVEAAGATGSGVPERYRDATRVRASERRALAWVRAAVRALQRT
ncbi:MAG: SET domain-containing protein-lysine N-methyltransferase [Pseudomonadota bacterium]|nr:SET domain-containing protein-lysine N-methyltransferase [Pseudomonadota bacterium]